MVGEILEKSARREGNAIGNATDIGRLTMTGKRGHENF